jgi:large subunit ribosomal protein L13
MQTNEQVIDCDSQILGRIASRAAKLLLKGSSVVLVNAEKAAISGHADDIVAEYKQKVEWKDKANPDHSPYWSRRPDMLVKRTVRGMLPYDKARGRDAFKRLRVYVGVPEGISPAKAEERSKGKFEVYEGTLTVKELCERLGYRLG